jgi:hypothetical protein
MRARGVMLEFEAEERLQAGLVKNMQVDPFHFIA